MSSAEKTELEFLHIDLEFIKFLNVNCIFPIYSYNKSKYFYVQFNGYGG